MKQYSGEKNYLKDSYSYPAPTSYFLNPSVPYIHIKVAKKICIKNTKKGKFYLIFFLVQFSFKPKVSMTSTDLFYLLRSNTSLTIRLDPDPVGRYNFKSSRIHIPAFDGIDVFNKISSLCCFEFCIRFL